MKHFRGKSLLAQLFAEDAAGPGLCLLLLPTLLAFTAFFCHEPWRDEIQAWLMARDMGFGALVANAGSEGHPIGWHLIAKALMTLGLPFASLQIFAFACALAAAVLLVRHGPFPFACKLLLLLSPIFLSLGILARPYSFIIMLLFLQAFLFPTRMRHPFLYALPLGCLSQLMVLCLPYVGLMGAWWFVEIGREDKKRFKFAALGLLALCFVLACIQLAPPVDKVAAMLLGAAPGAVSAAVPFTQVALDVVVWTLALTMTGAWLFILYKMRRMLLWIGLAVCLFALLVNAFVYPLSACHWYVLFAMLVALTWIARKEESSNSASTRADQQSIWSKACLAPLVCACFFSFPGGALDFYEQIRLPSSNLPQAAAYFRSNCGDRPVAAHTMAKICPLLLEMPEKRFWSPISCQWDSFAVFDANWHAKRNLNPEAAARIILARCPASEPLLIFSSPWPEHRQSGYALLVEFCDLSVYAECFYFYAPAVLAQELGKR